MSVVTPEMVQAARDAMDQIQSDREAAQANLSLLRVKWQKARDEWLRLVVLEQGHTEEFMNGECRCAKCNLAVEHAEPSE